MARNKYPEETVKKILDVAEELFITRGYERTTMADIVNHLGGLTKGAVYHHFKSKDEIFDAVFERANRPVLERARAVMSDHSLTGLEKIRALDAASSEGPSAEMWRAMQPSSDPVKSARILAREYQDLLETAHEFMEPAMREGIVDGSITTEHPHEVAEVLLLIANLWLVPLFNPVASREEYGRRAEVFFKIAHALGVDLAAFDSLDPERLEGVGVPEAWQPLASWRYVSSDAAGGASVACSDTPGGSRTPAESASDDGARTPAEPTAPVAPGTPYDGGGGSPASRSCSSCCRSTCST